MKRFFLLGLTFIFITFTSLVIGALLFGPKYVDSRINQTSPHSPFEVSDKANKLHKDLLIGDWHADSTLWNRDLSNQYDYGHVDIPRLQKGNVALQMFTSVSKSPRGQNYNKNETSANDNITLLVILQRWPIKTWSSLAERVIYQARKIRTLEKEDSQNFMLILSQSDLNDFMQKRKSNLDLIGGLLGTEGSHALDGELQNIERLFDEGFRMMSLQHFFDNKLGGSLHGISGRGLTKFGQEAIKEMLRLGIMIDVSHSSENVVKDVLSLSDQPILVSHTGFNGYCPSSRNISDSLMKEIAKKGGLVAVGFWDAAVCNNTPKSVAEAIQYGIKLIGAKHVALGSDFDGAVRPGFDSSELVAITHELLEAGVEESDIRLVMGENMFNFLKNNLAN
jgi:membrane dipeptidase|tara:strand:+ start:1323 stop:2501 length:1179 start_codon:yes stop_codon:yes gene_type:complete